MLDNLKALLPNEGVINKIVVPIEGLTKDQIIGFLTLVYHSHTPLLNIINAINRKFEAANTLNFPKLDDKFIHEDILLGKNTTMNMMMLEYCKHFRSSKYTTLKMNEDMLANEQRVLIGLVKSDLDDKELADTKRKVNLNIKDFSDTIEKLQAEFLTNDNSRDVLMDLYEEMSDEAFPFVEDIAEKIKRGQSPLGNFNPYV